MPRAIEKIPVPAISVAAALIGSAALAAAEPTVAIEPEKPKVHRLQEPVATAASLAVTDSVELHAGGGQHKQLHKKPAVPLITMDCEARTRHSSVVRLHLRGRNNEQLIYEYFRKSGLLSPAADAGLGGNTKVESHDNPTLPGGVFQDTGERWNHVQEIAAAQHKSPFDLCPQLENSSEELSGVPAAAENDRGILDQINAVTSPGTAAYILMEDFERPLSYASGPTRAHIASAIYHEYAQPHN